MDPLNRAIQMAIKMEKDGVDFYNEASQKVTRSSAKKMLLSFVEDEKKHLKILEKVFKEMNFSGYEKYFTGESPREKIKTIFSRARENFQEHISANTSEINILKTGIDMEQRSVDFYQDEARKTDREKARSLFERLIEEEKQHYQLLVNTLSYLENSRDWYLWEERALLDGG